jgi:S-disulfanyl-L-cysteine oxidoreductase SoxD
MRSVLNILVAVVAVSVSILSVLAQTPTYPNVGRTPTTKEMRDWAITISRDGKELLPGHGTAKEGAVVFLARGCAQCHGPSGYEGPAPRLVADEQTREGGLREQPYATIIWDFINRAMPMRQEGLLTPNEVYAVTAYLLYRNGIIQENDVMDPTTLPKVVMPHRDKIRIPDAKNWKPGAPSAAAAEPQHEHPGDVRPPR